ncbi:MAG: Rieske 2Fe-2S domain-containing protein [bacterium]
MSCEDCLSRREFLTRSTLAVAGAAALAAGCGDGHFGPTALTTTTSTVTLKVASLPELATQGQLVKIPQQLGLIAVKRTGASSFAAVSTVCTHQGCEVEVVGPILECPCHNSRFDSDGHVTSQPVGTGGSATNLPTYVTSYDPATDTLTIS